MEIFLRDGTRVTDEISVANAHPLGAKPFARADYHRKFQSLTAGIVSNDESARFLAMVERLPALAAGELHQLNVAVPPGALAQGKPGIF